MYINIYHIQLAKILLLPSKCDNFRKRVIKRSKELITKSIQRGLRMITLQGAIEKSPILLSQYWKNG